jgi:hypothetical protein
MKPTKTAHSGASIRAKLAKADKLLEAYTKKVGSMPAAMPQDSHAAILRHHKQRNGL